MRKSFTDIFGSVTTQERLEPQRVYDALMAGEIDFNAMTSAQHMRISEALSGLTDPQMLTGAFYRLSTSLSRAMREREEALTDEVTAISGRKSLGSEMEVSMFTSLCGGTGNGNPPIFMILDLDGFKAINDTLGHQAGDAVLAEFATRLRDAFESDDQPLNKVYRMGGDEFAVIVHNMHQEEAVDSARQAISKFVVNGENGEILPVSASVGAAIFQQRRKDDTPQSAISSVIAEADEQVYADKADKQDRLAAVLRETSPQTTSNIFQPA